MSDQPLSATEKAQLATRIGQLDEQIAARDATINTLQSRATTAKKEDQESIQTQIAAAREERSALLQEANTIRAQLGMPMVIPSTTQVLPQATIATTVPAKKKVSFMRGCLGLIALLIVGCVIYSLIPKGNSTATTSTGSTGASTGSNATAAASYGVGQDVKVGDVRWKVLDVKDEGKELKSPNEFTDAKPTAGKWIRMRVEVENQSKEQLNFSGVDIVDSQGRTFKSSTDAFMYVPNEEACPLAQLNANLPKTCQMVYELPADATGLKAVVGDLEILGSDEAKIDLGQ